MIPTAKGLILWPIDTKWTAENIPATKRARSPSRAPSIKSLTGWLHASQRREEKELKDWIRNNAEAAGG
jgi:hypothetical protein